MTMLVRRPDKSSEPDVEKPTKRFGRKAAPTADADTAEQPAVKPASSEPRSRVIQVYANLLPNEVIASRRLSALKRRLFAGLLALVVLLAAGYAYSWWQTSQTQDELADAQSQSVIATQQLRKFDPMVQTQASAASIQAQLSTAMASDLQWSDLLAKVRASAPPGLVVSQVTGSVNGPSGTPNPLAPADKTIVGQLSLAGTAHDYRSVATFVDALARVKGLTIVNPGSISGVGGSFAYSMTLSITSDAFGGRFTAKKPLAPSAAAATPGSR